MESYPLPTDPRFENADGTPHLAYYAGGVSFVWSGSAERPIQVCPGGYGEPVVDTIWFDKGGDGSTAEPPAAWWPAHQLIHEFRVACDRWLEAHR